MSSLEDRLTERMRQGSDEPVDPPAGPSDEPAAYDIGETCELDRPMNHHTCCVVGTGSGSVAFQGSLDGEHWYTITTITIEAASNAAFAGTPRQDSLTPTVFTHLRAIPDGELTGGPFHVLFGSS